MARFLLSLIIVSPWADGFVDVRHRFELHRMPGDLKTQIMKECNETFQTFFANRRNKVTDISSTDVPSLESGLCPPEVTYCYLSKTTPFMEHCTVKCLKQDDGTIEHTFNCWNDNCFERANRICVDKFWRTISIRAKNKKRHQIRCLPEIKHCYRLSCMKCLGRDCNIGCYGGGNVYKGLAPVKWKGYGEYEKFFPEVAEITHQYIIVPEAPPIHIRKRGE